MMESAPASPPPGPVLSRQSSHKLDETTRILKLLKDDFEKKTLLPPQRNKLLEQLKVFTRDAQDAEPLFSKEAIQTLCSHGFDGNSLITGREALKCLANVLLLKAPTRQYFVDLGYCPKAAEILKRDSRDDEFLGSRLLFLTTYETTADHTELFQNNGIADSINQNLARHAKYFAKIGKQPVAPMTNMAMIETLKLFFNLSFYYPDQVPVLTRSMLHICKIFTTIKLPYPPLQAPVTTIINSLLNLDLEDKRAHIFATNPLFPKFDPRCNVNRLYSILDQSIRHYKEEELEAQAVPLLTLMRSLYSFAPPGVQEHMKSIMLPSDEDRKSPLGRTETFSSYILRLSLAGGAPSVRDTIQKLLFELSDNDAQTFVQNVGYGFAAGFLFSNNIAIPETALEAGSSMVESREPKRAASVFDENAASGIDGDPLLSPIKNEEAGGERPNLIPVNLVTGQRLDAEAKDAGKEIPAVEMTEEEKEREAERLFVLFERLRATGVVNVENPVIKAYQEGRIQELPDEADDSDD